MLTRRFRLPKIREAMPSCSFFYPKDDMPGYTSQARAFEGRVRRAVSQRRSSGGRFSR